MLMTIWTPPESPDPSPDSPDAARGPYCIAIDAALRAICWSSGASSTLSTASCAFPTILRPAVLRTRHSAALMMGCRCSRQPNMPTPIPAASIGALSLPVLATSARYHATLARDSGRSATHALNPSASLIVPSFSGVSGCCSWAVASARTGGGSDEAAASMSAHAASMI